jgi:hypothetical protein
VGAPTVTVNRRQPIELNLPLSASGNGNAPAGDALQLDSPLDYPAFLRRQS